MPQLDFSTYPSQLFWLVVTFTTLYFILAVVILPRLAKVQTLRAENTSGKRQAALEATQKAEETLLTYESFIASARADALKEAQTLRAASDKVLNEKSESVRGRIEAQGQTAATEIRDFLARSQAEVAAAATQTAQEIFQKLTEPTH